MSRQKALEKMLKEMEAPHSTVADAIHNWLCDQVDDNELMEGICKEGKSISQSMEYCKQEAKKVSENGSAMIDDKIVFGWVRYYFLNDNLKVENVPGKITTGTKPKTKEKQQKPTKKEMEFEQISLFDFE